MICKRRFDPDRHGWVNDEDTYTRTLALLLERLSWFARDEGNIFEGAAPDWRLRLGVMTYTLAFIVRYRLASLRATRLAASRWPGSTDSERGLERRKPRKSDAGLNVRRSA
jgi:hypothetical protein